MKEKLLRRIKDKEAIDILLKIIDSNEQGLGIGHMVSQMLAVFHLNDLDCYIKEELKIKAYIRYQDDGLIFCESKQYLKECMEKIELFLKDEGLKYNPI